MSPRPYLAAKENCFRSPVLTHGNVRDERATSVAAGNGRGFENCRKLSDDSLLAAASAPRNFWLAMSSDEETSVSVAVCEVIPGMYVVPDSYELMPLEATVAVMSEQLLPGPLGNVLWFEFRSGLVLAGTLSLE